MRTWHVNYNLEGAARIRTILGEPHKKPDDIKRPKGMRTFQFDRHIRRLKNYETTAADLIVDGVREWILKENE